MLVVDDDEVIRRLIAVNLQLEGFEVETAVDGQDCLDKVAEIDPDVITLDVMMPRLDGWETAVQLRKSPDTAHIKVVLITARAQEDDKTRGARVGADAYLTKPFDPNEMIRVVRELAGSRPTVITAELRRAILAAAGHDARPAAPPGPAAGQLRLQPAVPPAPRHTPALAARLAARALDRRPPKSPAPATSPSPSPTTPSPASRCRSRGPDRPARPATRCAAAPRPARRRARTWPPCRTGRRPGPPSPHN